MPRKHEYDYDQEAAIRFIKYLGCHRFANPTDAVKRRDPDKYRYLLCKVIEINRNRTDLPGVWEFEAAVDALKKLGQ
jgi:hypothetical protein